jgi:hypothetical protein
MLGTLLFAAALAAPPAAPTPVAPPPAPVAEAPSRKFKFRTQPWREQRGVAITLSGGLAVDLVLEFTGEVNLPGQHSAALIFGLGAQQEQGYRVFDLLYLNAGGQYRYTALGDFDTGLYVGAEVLARIQPLAQGTPYDLPISPLVGFKYTAPFGLVVDLNAGPSVVVSNYRPVRAGAALNVQVGWAFGRKLIR